MKTNQSLNTESIEKIEVSKKAMKIWETHMTTFCSGRYSAFSLSSELIFALTQPDQSKNLRIIDIACGYGGWSKFIQEAAATKNLNIELTGMDGSEHRLSVYKDILGDSANTIQGDLLNTLPDLAKNNSDQLFDAVILGWASHEISQSNLEQIYKAVNLLLKPKGILLIADFVSALNPEVEEISKELIKKIREDLMSDPENQQQEQWLEDINNYNAHDHAKHNHKHHQHGKRNDYKVDEHFNFLNKAGFSVSEEVWRYMNSSMILAIK